MKIAADQTKCCGHARCASIAEDIFPLNSDGYIAVPEIIVPRGQEALATKGVRACPERALSVVNDDAAGLQQEGTDPD
ncbi:MULTISPECIES: ferredoxin [Burkholderia cepacia complex]|uniref:Ferredoxin n=1 Tax=Burkholderia multivorans TaxID=87883 RepID=A0A228EJQ1_9BURK|nr:ferredoxin [Burkholderia cenocepacia]MBU9123047.1 ferredoxin [Burkholderia multivorans]MCA7988762.1 ferredoxin [Burkholderia vietnamiensis]MBR8473603.1 ferredoxin [Burkholderia cenocepacia]MBR8493511.1 ferredoxin [Burkholderia cenocepacia]